MWSSWVIQTRVMSVEMDPQSCIQIMFLIITLCRIDKRLPSLDRRTPTLSCDMRVTNTSWAIQQRTMVVNLPTKSPLTWLETHSPWILWIFENSAFCFLLSFEKLVGTVCILVFATLLLIPDHPPQPLSTKYRHDSYHFSYWRVEAELSLQLQLPSSMFLWLLTAH